MKIMIKTLHLWGFFIYRLTILSLHIKSRTKMNKTNNMKIYRYKILSVSGNADPYTVFNNYYEEYQGIEYLQMLSLLNNIV